MKINVKKESVWIVGGFLLLLTIYHLIYSQFFPAANGMMGHDWSLAGKVPVIAGGYEGGGGWAQKAQASPAICNSGVSLELTNFPLTLEGWLFYFGANPILTVYLNFIFYAALGFWGMFFLLRNTFRLGYEVAFLGGALLLFNEFFASRIVIGHPYYSAMLVPMIMYLLTRHEKFGLGAISEIMHGILAGVVLFYAWAVGMMPLVVTILLSMITIGLLALISGTPLKSLLMRASIALIVALGWSWLSLSQSLFSESLGIALAQRQSYSMQGFTSLWEGLRFIASAVFYGPADAAEQYAHAVTNLSVGQGRHELEYSVGPAVPLLLIMSIAYALAAWVKSDAFFNIVWWRRNVIWLLLLMVILLFPLLYNTYSPLTVGLWKKLPLINSTTSPQRTFFVYSIVFVLITSLLVQRYLPSRFLLPTVLASVALTVGATATKDRAYYQNQPYDTKPVMEAWYRYKLGDMVPAIGQISLLVDQQGRPIHNQMLEANERLYGRQPMGCYVPGYSSVPIELLKQLHPGSIWDEKDGFFNIKNPACNTWPKENNCSPGDHFRSDQKAWVESYVHYKDFPIVVPSRVLAAAWVSRFSIVITIAFVVGFFVYFVYKKLFNCAEPKRVENAEN